MATRSSSGSSNGSIDISPFGQLGQALVNGQEVLAQWNGGQVLHTQNPLTMGQRAEARNVATSSSSGSDDGSIDISSFCDIDRAMWDEQQTPTMTELLTMIQRLEKTCRIERERNRIERERRVNMRCQG